MEQDSTQEQSVQSEHHPQPKESNTVQDKGRRRFLTWTTVAVGAAGAVVAGVPFFASWSPSARAQAAGAPVEIDISKLEVGALVVVEWRGKPVWVVRRSAETIKQLKGPTDHLRDPYSEVEQQPAYAKNVHRALNEEVIVLVGICTHLGCSPAYRPVANSVEDGWLGGFYCPCHGSKFDMSGRVFNGVPAPLNMEVPPHTYLSENRLLIGVDAEVV